MGQITLGQNACNPIDPLDLGFLTFLVDTTSSERARLRYGGPGLDELHTIIHNIQGWCRIPRSQFQEQQEVFSPNSRNFSVKFQERPCIFNMHKEVPSMYIHYGYNKFSPLH